MIPLGCVQDSSGGGGGGPGVYHIEIFLDALNINLLDEFESLYGTPQTGDTVSFEIISGVVTGSSSATLPSIRTGVWPNSVKPYLTHSTLTRGAGGNGNGPNPGQRGGTAFLAECPVTVDNTAGTFAGGGGGGAGSDSYPGTSNPSNTYSSGGGGGAGNVPGAGGIAAGATNAVNGNGGSFNSGGLAGSHGSDPNQNSLARGGAGGNLGQNGYNAADVGQPGSSDNVGGLAGYAVDGYGFITWVNVGTIVGPTRI